MKRIRTIKSIESENFGQVDTMDFELSYQKSLWQKMFVKHYQLDSDIVQQKISESISQFIESDDVHLDFEIDIEKGLIWMKVISTITGDIIKEIFPRTILYTNENLKVMMGILVDRKA